MDSKHQKSTASKPRPVIQWPKDQRSRFIDTRSPKGFALAARNPEFLRQLIRNEQLLFERMEAKVYPRAPPSKAQLANKSSEEPL